MNNATVRELSPRARAIAVVLWASFLVAGVGTTFCFAFVAPSELVTGAGDTAREHLGVYTLGFFGLWLLAALASSLSLFLYRASSPTSPPAPATDLGERRE